jgi:hypothetical protein
MVYKNLFAGSRKKNKTLGNSIPINAPIVAYTACIKENQVSINVSVSNIQRSKWMYAILIDDLGCCCLN